MPAAHYIIRTALVEDFSLIAELYQSTEMTFFGVVKEAPLTKEKIFHIYQTHRLLIFNATNLNSLVAYAEFRNFPNLPAIPSDCWMLWLRHHFCIDLPITLINTMFLNYLMYNPKENIDIKSILAEIFYRELRVQFCLFVELPYIEKYGENQGEFEGLLKFSKVIHPMDFNIVLNTKAPTIYIIHRDSIIPKMIHRKCLPEDNDDIVEILDLECSKLRQEYGDYYIAEELLREDEEHSKNILIISEVGDSTAGFAWLSNDTDIDALIRNFDFEMFGNLVVCDKDLPYQCVNFDVDASQPKKSMKLFTDVTLFDLEETKIMGGRMWNDNLASVLSTEKLLITSNEDVIASSDLNYNEKEDVFLKFQYLYDKMRRNDYYQEKREDIVNVCFNSNKHSEEKNMSINDASNVFSIRHIGIHPNFRQEQLFYILCCAFTAFPERDYCLISIPANVEITPCVAKILSYFVNIPPRPRCTIPNRLYLTHRSSIYGEISVHEMRQEDILPIRTLCKHNLVIQESLMTNTSVAYSMKANEFADEEYENEVIFNIISNIFGDGHSEFQILTIRCGNSARPADENTFIGFVILRKLQNFQKLFYNFYVPYNEYHLEHSRAEVVTLRLHPLFHSSVEDLFRQIACKTEFWDFYYISPLEGFALTNDVCNQMMAVEPRRRKKNWFGKLLEPYTVYGTVKGMKNINSRDDHVQIFRSNMQPIKYFGNPKPIVIIGFTNNTKAFLRILAFMWNSTDLYNAKRYCCLPKWNVTVIVRPGVLEAEYDKQFSCKSCTVSKHCYLQYQNCAAFVRDITNRMDLRNWFQFVPGYVTQIDRKAKTVTLNTGCVVVYDTLLLMDSTNFGIKSGVSLHNQLPCNYAHINTRLDKFILYHKINVLKSQPTENYRILIYGDCIQTFECINFLLTHGVKGTNITLVIPHHVHGLTEKLNIANRDRNIELILMEEMMVDLGVKVIDNCLFQHWKQFHNKNIISSVAFKNYSSGNVQYLQCDFYINFDEVLMDQRYRLIFEKSGIEIVNNCIEVNQNYQTKNDPNIYAIGKYINMSGEPNYQYKYTSEKEDAEKLMHILQMDTTNDKFERKHSQPTYFQSLLPMNHCFTKIIMPNRNSLQNYLSKEYSRPMTTYKEGNFCRVRLNNQLVDEIVVVSQVYRKLDFLEHFCGKHESMLNKLEARFKGKGIDCFLEFFQEPWTELIMHDKFDKLQEKNRQRLRPLVEHLLDLNIERKTRFTRTVHALESSAALLERGLLRFLRQHRHDFVNSFALPEDFWAPNVRLD